MLETWRILRNRAVFVRSALEKNMMDLPLLTYVATMSVTPGPNNLMLAASGANFGLRRTVPHLVGVSLGHGLHIFMVGLALSWILQWLDAFRWPLVLAGCAYLFWLAWRQAKAGQPQARQQARPYRLVHGVLFQWVNPKGWMMVINTVILFLPQGSGWQNGMLFSLGCIAVNFPCVAVWAVAGDRLRFWLQQPERLRLFNYTMAFLLAATALWILATEPLPGAAGAMPPS